MAFVICDQRNIITIVAMADQPTEKPEVKAPAPDAQEAPAAEKPAEQSSTGDNAAKTEGEASKEDTKVAEGESRIGCILRLLRTGLQCP